MPNHLDQLAKILNQAMNASTPEEKEAYFEKAQSLSSKWSIELAVARSHIAKLQDREQPIVKTIRLAASNTQNRHVWCELFMAIGRANDIKFNIAHGSTYVIAFGMPSDIEVTEALYASISVQMIEMCQAFLATGEYKNETVTRYNKKTWEWEMKPQTSRVAKRVFYETFSSHIGQRLRRARDEARASAVAADTERDETGRTSTELVLVGKELEIQDFYNARSTARGSWKGGRGNTYTSSTGANAGRTAAQNARLTGRQAIGGGRKAIG